MAPVAATKKQIGMNFITRKPVKMQERGVEPLHLSVQDPKSCASANSATPATLRIIRSYLPAGLRQALAKTAGSASLSLPRMTVDPIELELMRNFFEAAAEQMGLTLARVAF